MIGSILVVALQGVRSHPLRSVLAVLSLGLGVVGVVTMAAASSTVSAAIEQNALMRGGPRATVEITVETPRSASALMAAAQEDLRRQVRAASFSLGATMPGLTGLIGNEVTPMEVSFVESSIRDIRPFVVVSGSWIDDTPRLVPLAAINQAAQQLGRGLGESVVLVGGDHDPLQVAIAGVVDDGSTAPRIYVSLNGAREWTSLRATSSTESLTVSGSGVDAERILARLNELSSLMDIPATWTVRRTDTLGELADPLKATRSSFSIVGYLGLLTAIIAIGNLGLSTVRERAAELSVRRALGARRLDVALIMIVEAGIIGLLSGLLAIPSSVLLYSVIGNAFNAPYGVALPPYPVEYALAGFFVGLGASLLAGLAPSLRSAMLPISTFSRE